MITQALHYESFIIHSQAIQNQKPTAKRAVGGQLPADSRQAAGATARGRGCLSRRKRGAGPRVRPKAHRPHAVALQGNSLTKHRGTKCALAVLARQTDPQNR